MALTLDGMLPDTNQRAWKLVASTLSSQRQVDSALDIHEAIENGFTLRKQGSDHWFSAFFEQGGAFEGEAKSTNGANSSAPDIRLSPFASAAMYQLAVAFEEALDVFGSKKAAISFFQQPAVALNRQKPINLMRTPPGVQLVRTHIQRMRYCVYS